MKTNFEKGKLIDLVYLKQDHAAKEKECSLIIVELHKKIGFHKAERIKLEKQLEKIIIERGI